MKPLVSVVVATYRRDHSLINALESLAVQTYENFEIVLVDDSDDAQWNQKVSDIVDAYREAHSGIALKHIVNHPNKGSAMTRNIGIENSDGAYITFLDDDDVYLPEKIAHQLEGMLREQADYSITDLMLYNDKDKLIDKRNRSYIQKTDKASLQEYHLMYHMTCTDSMMYKKEYLKKIGGFDPIDLGDEYYLMQKAIDADGKFCYVPGCMFKAYVHKGEQGLSSGQSKITCESLLYAHKKKYFPQVSLKIRRHIRMRHYAVLAFAGIRMRSLWVVLKNGMISFLCAPIACVRLCLERKI